VAWPLQLSTDIFDGLPDPYSFAGAFKPAVDAIENQLSPLDDYITVTSILTIADIFGAADQISGDLDFMIEDFTSYDFSEPFTQGVSSFGQMDNGISAGNKAIASTSSGVGAIPITIPGVGGITVTPAGEQQPPPNIIEPPVGSPTGPHTTGTSVQLTDTGDGRVNPGYVFHGDGFLVTVVAKPGFPIYVIANHDGKNHGQAMMGNTNPKGVLYISGMWGMADRGAWQENWYVGADFIGSLNFTVE
jgi:hypothetical protein